MFKTVLHVLLRTIARVNRPYEDEAGLAELCGLIIDFVGIFDNLKKAPAFDSGEIEDVVKNIAKLKEGFRELMEGPTVEYLLLVFEKPPDKAVEAVLNRFMDDTSRCDMYEYYQELSNLYEILSPDTFLRPLKEVCN